LAKTKKGTKPDFHGAASPEEASRLYRYFVQRVKDMYQVDRVKDGKFQAMMEVALVNDGPVSAADMRPSSTV
jgi:D-tyrosyl-tRNA(Tyr) deacylase